MKAKTLTDTEIAITMFPTLSYSQTEQLCDEGCSTLAFIEQTLFDASQSLSKLDGQRCLSL